MLYSIRIILKGIFILSPSKHYYCLASTLECGISTSVMVLFGINHRSSSQQKKDAVQPFATYLRNSHCTSTCLLSQKQPMHCHLSPVSLTIQDKQDMQWALTRGRARVGQTVRTYIYQLYENAESSLEDLLRAIDGRDDLLLEVVFEYCFLPFSHVKTISYTLFYRGKLQTRTPPIKQSITDHFTSHSYWPANRDRDGEEGQKYPLYPFDRLGL